MKDFQSYIDTHYERFQEELFGLLRIPGVSPVGGFEKEIQACAASFAEHMNAVGIRANVYQTKGSPIIYGEGEQIDGRPTILVYGHYDVQPAGDLSLWESDPYMPEVRNGRIYARGVADNKGQIFAHIKGYEIYRAVCGEPNVNMKYLLEGEEECGSEQLALFAQQYRDMLKADVTVWSDGGVHASGRPVVLLGLKGLGVVTIKVKGPVRDIHSKFSSVLPNPIWKLTKIMSALKDENGNVLVPDFYDGVQKPSEAELEAIRKIPGTLAEYTDDWQVTTLLHNVDKEAFYTRCMFEPTLNCGCISAGDPTASKNIIPSEATAWLDIRTVPQQDTAEICKKIEAYIHTLGIEGVETESRGNNAAYTAMSNSFVQPILHVLHETWGKEPILYPALGGSGPFHVFNSVIGAPCIMVPYADAQQHDHGPNESFPVELYKRAMKTSAALIQRFGKSL